jgi:hypothetical protein
MPAWRNKLQVVLLLVIGLSGVAVGILLFYLQVHDTAELNSYHSAAACAAAADALQGETCRYRGPATVTVAFDPTARTAGLAFAALPGKTFTAKFSRISQPEPTSGSAGSSIMAELWSGRVTQFASVVTADSPENLPVNNEPAGWIFGAVGLFVAGWAAAYVPRAWRAR